jgi:hypothetical protein
LPAHARRRLRCGNRRLLGMRIRGTLRRQTANQNTRCQHAHPKTERNLPIHSGGIVPSFGVLLRYQVAPQVPVLVFCARVAYLLVHRPTVAVVYPLQRGAATLPTALRYQIPSMIAIPFPTVPCANVRRTRFRLQPFCRPSIVITSIGSAYPHNFAGCVYIMAQDFAIVKAGTGEFGGILVGNRAFLSKRKNSRAGFTTALMPKGLSYGTIPLLEVCIE